MRLRLIWLLIASQMAVLAMPAGLSAQAGFAGRQAQAGLPDRQIQAWLPDRARTQGRGIRVGNFELHPGIGADGGYDSNVFLAADTEDEPAQDSPVLRLAPHFYISTREIEEGPPPAFRLRAGVSGLGRYYFFEGGGFSLGLGQDLNLVINPDRPFTVEIRESYRMDQDPFTEPAGPGSGSVSRDISFSDFGRHQLSVGPYFQLSTPGGLLKAGVGYNFTMDNFVNGQFEGNDTQRHSVLSNASWEFLPKTAVFWNAAVGRRLYDDPTAAVGVERNDGWEVASRLGLNGALTSKVSFTLAAGYGANVYEDDNDAENVLAQAQLRWRPERNLGVTAGYERELNSAFQGNFATLDRIKLLSGLMFGGSFLLQLRSELTFVDYGRDDAIAARAEEAEDIANVDLSGATAERNDVHVLVGLSGEYRFADWLALTADFGYLNNITDFVYPPAIVIQDGVAELLGSPDAAEYQRFEAWLGLRAFL